MIIRLKEKLNDKVLAGTEIEIKPNTVNWFVGHNGCGKTITFSSLAHHIGKPLHGKRLNWMSRPREHLLAKFQFVGFESVEKVFLSTSKVRQSQWVDAEMAIDSPMSVACLNASEGMMHQSELASLLPTKDDPNILYIFDEIDGSFDVRIKKAFFDRIIYSLAGTVIICTHDCFFPIGQMVYDMTTGKRMKFEEYFRQIP